MEHGHRRFVSLQKLLIMMVAFCAALMSTGKFNRVYAADDWFTDYTYTLDETGKNIIITKSNGALGESAVIPGSATIEGTTYTTVLDNSGNDIKSLWSADASTLTSITIQNGVKAAAGSKALFCQLSKLTTLDVSGLDTSDMTDMSYMFYGVSSLTDLNLATFNTSNVTNMKYMFNKCTSLKNLNINSFDTSKVTDMDSMFKDDTKLLYLDLENFDTTNVKKMNMMFYACKSMIYLNVSSFKTPNLTTTEKMFYNFGNGIRDLDIRNFDMAKTNIETSRSSMFTGANMTNLYLPADNTIAQYDFTNNSELCRIYYAGTQDKWNDLGNTIGTDIILTCDYTEKITSSQAQVSTYATDSWYEDYNYYIDKKNYKLILLSSTGKMSANGKTSLVVPGYTKIDGYIYTTVLNCEDKVSSKSLWSSDKSSLTELTINKGVELSDDCTGLFKGLTKLKTINLNNVDTSKVVKMKEMFMSDSALANINLTGFDTSSVINMQSMFSGCTALKALSLDGFDTKEVTNMKNMFKGVKIVDLDLRGFDFSKATLTNFLNSSYITNIYLPADAMSSFDFSDSSSAGYSLKKIYYEGSQTEWEDLKNTVKSTTEVIYDYNGEIPKIAVMFDGNGGTASGTGITVEYGGTYGTLPTATRADYTFAGWYTAADGGTLVTSDTQVTNENAHTLYAHWTKTVIKATVTFNANGGSVSTGTKEVVFGEAYGTLPTPTKTGYTFNGWYTAASNGSLVTEATIVETSSPHTLYAQWTEVITEVSVSLNANGNGATVTPGSIKVEIGGTYGNLPTPVLQDYKFIGWYTSSTGGTLVTSTTALISNTAHTLYAHWQKANVTVYFDANGGSVTEDEKKVTIGEAYGTLPVPTRKDYIFAGWYTEDVGGDKVSAETSVTDEDDHYLYAHWVYNTVMVSFYSYDGAGITSKEYVVGSKYGELPAPTRSGYVFNGWYTQSNGGGEKITADSDVSGEESIMLYAYWVKATVTVKFNANGGNVSSSSKEIEFGGAYGELPMPTRDGYNFNGWYTESTGGTKVTSETSLVKNTEHTLYAHWDKTVIVSFDGNGNGASVFNKTLTVGQKYGELTIPTRTGYDFAGWYTAKTGGELITKDVTVENETSHVLYAHWIKQTITVSFYGDKVSSVDPKEVSYNEAYGELPQLTYSGYEFKGWYTAQVGGDKVTAETIVTEKNDHSLYAHWDKTVKVSFDGNGNGDAVFSKTLIVTQKYGELTTPVRSGYDFAGWYTDKTAGDKVTADTVVSNEDAHVLYAHWIKQTITVTFKGGMVSDVNPSSKEVTPGETYGLLPQLSLDGYEFKGWYTEAVGGELITAGTTVTNGSDHYLFAQWKKEDIQVQVSFDGVLENVGNVPDNRMVTVGLEYGEMSLPNKSGYEFIGWYTEKTGGERIYATTVVQNENSHILYAHWKKKTITVTFIGDKVTSATSQTVTYGEKYGTLPVLTASGYEFKGWYTEAEGGSLVNADTTVSNVNDHYLYAQWKKEELKVTVSFDGNGNGDAVFNKTLTVGQKYGELTEPTRTGYDFEGWYTEKTSGSLITEDVVVENENSHILYAHWKKKTITVTFNGDKVTSVTPQTVTYGEEYGTLPKLEFGGYVFQGWYTEADGGTIVSESTIVTEKSDHYLYAHWKKASVTVSFDGNGDGVGEIPNKTFTVGEAYGELTEPARSGYNFDGWYTKASGGDKIAAETIVENENAHILYAHWVKATITVTLNGDKVTDVDPITVTSGGKYEGLPTLSLDGFEFNGWYTEAVGGTNITTETTVTAVDNHTLFAHWTAVVEPEITTVTVSFDGNGDSVSDIPANKSYTYGEKYGIIGSPTRTNYKFDGWYTEKESGTKITSDSLVKDKNSHVLYAHWIKMTVKVTFNGDLKSEVTPKFINATPGKLYGESSDLLPVLTLDDYDFLGWYTEAVGGDKITDTSTVLINTDHFLFAHWKEKVKKVNVLFDGNGDGVSNVPSNSVMTVGDTYGELTTPKRDGYDFDGWYTEAEAGERVTKDTVVINEKPHVLYAHWIKKTITVTFNGDKVADITPGSKEVVSGEQYGDLPKPTLTGYIFNGWYTEASGGDQITEETLVREKADHILFAKWTEENKKVNVFFDGNADDVSNVPGTVALTVGEKYGTIADPEKDGYDFDGWYTDKEEGVQVTADTIVTNEASHVLYAHWVKKSITVTFNGDKVADIDPKYITVEHNKAYGDLPNPTLSGYTFKGWYTAAVGGDNITKDTIVTAKNDHILFAQWVEVDKQVSVSFDGNGDSVTNIPDNKTLTVGQKYGEMTEAYRDGYKFDGWYTKPDGGDKIDADTEVTNENTHILYAHWIKNSITVTFNAGKVDDPESISVKSGEAYGTLPSLELEGYQFMGWFTEAIGGDEITKDTIVKAQSDHILFAQWEEDVRVTVSFIGNGDNVTGLPDNKSLKTGDYYGVLATPNREGYSFDGWFTQASGGDEVKSDTQMNSTKSHSLYAHWTKDSVIVTFNGGLVSNVSPANMEVKPGETYGKNNKLPELSLDGYNFLGWYTEPSGGEKIDNDTTVKEKNDHILFAQWKEVSKIITVSFSGNGEDVTNVPENRTLTVGLTYGTMADASRDGYDFAGWYTEPEGGSLVNAETTVLIEYSHTLYAHWIQQEKKVTVIFHPNRGTVDTVSKTVTVNGTYGELPTATRENYRFDGWYTSATGGEQVTEDTEVTNENTHTLYAQWYEKDKKIMVSFSANGGTVKSAGKEVEAGLLYGDLPNATKEGYIFDGWYTKAEGGVKVTAETKVTQKSAHTLYAHWADLYKKVWVSFNANGGIISPESEEFSVGLTYNGLPVPSRKGYKFDGWYTSMEDGERITDDSVVENEDPHTLYAYWTNENDIISVTFNANGGTVDKHEMTIVVGKPYGELPTPQLAGMEFAGWYTEAEAGELVTAETIVKLEVAHTLFARWKQPESSNPGGGEVPDPIPVVPADPTAPSDPGTGDSTGGQGTGTDTQVDNQSKVAAVNTVISDKNNTKYKVTSSDESKPTVSYSGNKLKSKTITVPSKVTIDGVSYTVTKIEANAFKNNKNLTKIIIEKNVTSISKNAFKGCKKLKLIIVKSTKLTDKSVAKGAFKGVSKKVKIKVPKKKYTAYKKLFRKRGLSSKVKILKG